MYWCTKVITFFIIIGIKNIDCTYFDSQFDKKILKVNKKTKTTVFLLLLGYRAKKFLAKYVEGMFLSFIDAYFANSTNQNL